MITKYQALIFDADGTLAETEELHQKAFNQTFQKWCLDWHWDFEIYKQLLKLSGGKERLHHYMALSQTKGTILTQQQILEFHSGKTQLYFKSIEKTLPLRQEVKTIVKEAPNNGVKLAIATATNMENVKLLIAITLEIDINDLFTVVITSKMDKKTIPRSILNCLP